MLFRCSIIPICGTGQKGLRRDITSMLFTCLAVGQCSIHEIEPQAGFAKRTRLL